MATTGTCACYFCDGYPVWQIWLGESEHPESTYACGVHARGHLRRAIQPETRGSLLLTEDLEHAGERRTLPLAPHPGEEMAGWRV
jgi:hypothetical protein